MSRAFLEGCPKRHLVIHMDLNKTIIQVDSAGGKTMEDIFNNNVAANVLGRCVGEKWVAIMGPDQVGDRSDLVAFDDYVDRMHPEPPGMQELSKAEKNCIWREISERRRAELRRFTHTGQPGEEYKHHIDEQRAVLTAAPNHLIIPSFFELINTLSELDWYFTLIFRTFGNDLANVLREWREFVFGEHVYQPRGAVLEHMKKTYTPATTGCIFREGGQLFFCVGPDTAAVVEHPGGTKTLIAAEIIEKLSLMPSCKEVHQMDFALLHDQLLDCAATSNNVSGIVDYYPFWAQGAERRSGGKVFPVYTAPSSNSKPPFFYVFFDDNICIGEEKSILDLRDAETGESITDVAVEKKYCISVNPYKAIVEKNYFVDCLAEAIKLQLRDK